MFFLIRCVFWLTVVFTTIFSQDSVRQAPPVAPQYSQAQAAQHVRLAALAQTWAGAAVALIERKAVEDCAEANCLTKIATLSNNAAPPVPSVAQAALPPAVAVQVAVPLPPRRPAFPAANIRRSGLEKSSRAEYVIGHSGQS